MLPTNNLHAHQAARTLPTKSLVHAGVLLVLFVLVDVVSQNRSGRDDVTHDFIFIHIYAQLKCLV